MTGLYIREMLARRLIQRVLIVPPAGLVGNWQSELRELVRTGFRGRHRRRPLTRAQSVLNGAGGDR